jgi:molecular chaperone GrpE
MALALQTGRDRMKKRIRNFFRSMSTEENSQNPEPEILNEMPEASEADAQVVPDGPAVEATADAPSDVNAQEAQLDNWEAKYRDINDRYLRLYSEFDNYKKRTSRERIEFAKTAAADIFTAILPVLDDFDRAAKAMEQTNATVESLREGMQLVHQKMKRLLLSKGLEEMDATGQDFDADVHEAITQIPSPDPSMKGKVIDMVEKGYALNGKVIRFAKVVVGS